MCPLLKFTKTCVCKSVVLLFAFLRISVSNAYRVGVEDEEGSMMKAGLHPECLDVDLDRLSQGSNDTSFSFESAQTEVMMKALGNNGEGHVT